MRYLVSLGLVLAVQGFVGCATAPQTTEQKATTPEVRPSVSTDKDQADPPQPSVEEPTPEELTSSPCGNPNWAQLPPESEVDGDRAEKDEEDKDGEEAQQ